MDKKDKMILVTGSNGELGSRLVDYLINLGYKNVYCHYHKSFSQISRVLERYGYSIEDRGLYADLTMENDVKTMQKKLSAYGELYCLINLAGGSTNAMVWKLSIKEFKAVIEQNLVSSFICSKVFIPNMRIAKEGRIINISSVVADIGAVGATHYSAAKAGINGLTRSLALELSNKNITVNAIALGYCDCGLINDIPQHQQLMIKEIIPAKKFATVSNFGKLIDFLCDSEAGYITGQTLHVNGGLYLT